MRSILIIGAGGFIGAVLRYLAVLSLQVIKTKTGIPLGTLVVNVVGCLLIGFLVALAESSQLVSADAKNFLVIGILGAFTTFSTFGYETFTFLKNGMQFQFFMNVGLQLFLGLLAVWAGIELARLVQKSV